MSVEITAIGGYDEIGKNMTVVSFGGEAIVLDMGIHVERLMGEDYNIARMSREELLGIGAIPDYRRIREIREKVVGVFIGHAHLDHVGAAGKLAGLFKGVPFYMTPFTAGVFKSQIDDEEKYRGQKPDVRIVTAGAKIAAGQNFVVEFIAAAHSIPDATILAVHTPKGIFLYALDWKFDEHPGIGNRTNIARLAQLGEKGRVLAVAFDTTRIERSDPTKGEAWAKEQIVNKIGELDGEGIIATTFASHISRLQTLIDAGRDQKRKVLLLGRSMEKYTNVAKELRLISLGRADVWGRPKSIQATLSKIKNDKEKYLLIVTGNQGEPGSVLDRMVQGVLPYKFDNLDNVLFCSEAIPTPMNLACRKDIERRLRSMGAHVHLGLHVSGHASAADIERFVKLVKPEEIIPTHGGIDKLLRARKLMESIGYPADKVHLLHDGESVRLN
ncbi:MAG: MBL fold metallo-hydrolase RNA specificity domain-containing protein [archaeon]